MILKNYILSALVLVLFIQMTVGASVNSFDGKEIPNKTNAISQGITFHPYPGIDDICDRRFLLSPQAFLQDLQYEITYESFSTDGEDICIYGQINLDRDDLWIEFFFTDDLGFEEYNSTASTTRKYLHELNLYSTYSWNEILPVVYEGETVETWYVVISIVAAPITEPAREGNFYVGQDLKGPDISISFPSVINDTNTAIISLHEYNCELQLLVVKIDNVDEISRESITGTQWTGSIVVNPEGYSNGIHYLNVWACDSGNSWEYSVYEFAIDIEPATTPPPVTYPPLVNLTTVYVTLMNFLNDPLMPITMGIGLFALFVTFIEIRRKSQSDIAPWKLFLLAIIVGIFLFIIFSGYISIVISGAALGAAGLKEFIEWRNEKGQASQQKQIDILLKRDMERESQMKQMEEEIENLKSRDSSTDESST